MKDFYPVGDDFSVYNAARLEHFTFTFVRHPFSRIVSAYTNKFDHVWSEKPKLAEFRDVKDEMAIKAGIARNR